VVNCQIKIKVKMLRLMSIRVYFFGTRSPTSCGFSKLKVRIVHLLACDDIVLSNCRLSHNSVTTYRIIEIWAPVLSWHVPPYKLKRLELCIRKLASELAFDHFTKFLVLLSYLCTHHRVSQ
jgi:hypothetical protein